MNGSKRLFSTCENEGCIMVRIMVLSPSGLCNMTSKFSRISWTMNPFRRDQAVPKSSLRVQVPDIVSFQACNWTVFLSTNSFASDAARSLKPNFCYSALTEFAGSAIENRALFLNNTRLYTDHFSHSKWRLDVYFSTLSPPRWASLKGKIWLKVEIGDRVIDTFAVAVVCIIYATVI